MQSSQNAVTRYIVKKGNQQTMKQPTMMPRVLAAFVSTRNLRTWFLIFLRPNVRFCLAATGTPPAATAKEAEWLTTLPIIAATPPIALRSSVDPGKERFSSDGVSRLILIEPPPIELEWRLRFCRNRFSVKMSNILGVLWRQRRGWHSKHVTVLLEELRWWWPDPTLMTSSSPWLLDLLQDDSNPRLRRSTLKDDVPLFKLVVNLNGFADSSVSEDISSSWLFDGHRKARQPLRPLVFLTTVADVPALFAISAFCLARVWVPLSENVLPAMWFGQGWCWLRRGDESSSSSSRTFPFRPAL